MEIFIDNLDIKPATKKMYKSIIKVSGYTGNESNIEINKIIDKLTINQKNKLLSVLRKYKPEDEFIKRLYKEYINKKLLEPKKEMPVFDIPAIKEEITTFPLNYRFLYSLLINHPVLRLQDYHSINLYKGNCNNYIIGKKIIFNQLVKVPGKREIILNNDELKMVRELRKSNNPLWQSLALFQKDTLEQCKLMGLKGISDFRKLHGSSLTEEQKTLINDNIQYAKSQNHSLNTMMSYYT